MFFSFVFDLPHNSGARIINTYRPISERVFVLVPHVIYGVVVDVFAYILMPSRSSTQIVLSVSMCVRARDSRAIQKAIFMMKNVKQKSAENKRTYVFFAALNH